MKKYFVFLSFMLLMHNVLAQVLLDVYKKGTVKLVPDSEYGKDNQWDKVFESYYDTLYNAHIKSPIGVRKSLVVMPDGSVVVSHRYKDFYSLFDPAGKFVKEFNLKGSSGKKLKEVDQIQGIINNNFYTDFDNMGKSICFDFNGNYVKTLSVDYMVFQSVPISNNKIAVAGWVIWKDRQRDLVAIIDYKTNEHKIIWDYFYVTKGGNFVYTESHGFKGTPIPKGVPIGEGLRPQIAFVNNRLIIAIPGSGDILIYDVNGKFISKEKAEWEPKYISVQEQKESKEKAIERVLYNIEHKEKKGYRFFPDLATQLKDLKAELENITTPKPLPMFSNVLKDSDGNLLFFEMAETEGGNKFNVWIYQEGGKFVCQSSFVCDDFDLIITPSKMVFHNGYIYSLQTLKNAKGNPLRLVRFKVTN